MVWFFDFGASLACKLKFPLLNYLYFFRDLLYLVYMAV